MAGEDQEIPGCRPFVPDGGVDDDVGVGGVLVRERPLLHQDAGAVRAAIRPPPDRALAVGTDLWRADELHLAESIDQRPTEFAPGPARCGGVHDDREAGCGEPDLGEAIDRQTGEIAPLAPMTSRVDEHGLAGACQRCRHEDDGAVHDVPLGVAIPRLRGQHRAEPVELQHAHRRPNTRQPLGGQPRQR